MTNKDLEYTKKLLKATKVEYAKVRSEVRRMKERYGWSSWEPYTVGIIPKRVNGRWYFKGDVIYRKEKMKYLTSSKEYKYGDDFDVLKDI